MIFCNLNLLSICLACCWWVLVLSYTSPVIYAQPSLGWLSQVHPFRVAAVALRLWLVILPSIPAKEHILDNFTSSVCLPTGWLLYQGDVGLLLLLVQNKECVHEMNPFNRGPLPPLSAWLDTDIISTMSSFTRRCLILMRSVVTPAYLHLGSWID